MTKNVFWSLLLISIHTTTYTSVEQTPPATTTHHQKIDELDYLYETYQQEHNNITQLLKSLTPLIEKMPTLPGTENAKKTYHEMKKQHDQCAWYMAYATGWNTNRQEQRWSQDELEILIALKKADFNHLQTIFNSFSRYATIKNMTKTQGMTTPTNENQQRQ